MECLHGFKELRRREFLDGAVFFGTQCLRCGLLIGSWIQGERAVAFLSSQKYHPWDMELWSAFLKGFKYVR